VGGGGLEGAKGRAQKKLQLEGKKEENQNETKREGIK